MEVIAGPSTARWSLYPRIDAEVSVEPRRTNQDGNAQPDRFPNVEPETLLASK